MGHVIWPIPAAPKGQHRLVHESDFGRDGFTTLPTVIRPDRCLAIAAELADRLADDSAAAIGAGQGGVVGGRNLMCTWKGWHEITSHPPITTFLTRHVGPESGLVRILFFDKPPGQGWSLSIHRDQTIAVDSHHAPPAPYSKPTRKAGVPHVVADSALLQSMATLRLHLDPMHDGNGPLVVIPGSHLEDDPSSSRASDTDLRVIHARRGDVFAMRPLLLHGSRDAEPSTTDHRRVLHLEFAPSPKLPPPYKWFRFEPALPASSTTTR